MFHKTISLDVKANNPRDAHEEFLNRYPKYRNRLYIFSEPLLEYGAADETPSLVVPPPNPWSDLIPTGGNS